MRFGSSRREEGKLLKDEGSKREMKMKRGLNTLKS